MKRFFVKPFMKLFKFIIKKYCLVRIPIIIVIVISRLPASLAELMFDWISCSSNCLAAASCLSQLKVLTNNNGVKTILNQLEAAAVSKVGAKPVTSHYIYLA